MELSENYSCVNCIWHDQCESDVPCDFFDTGRSGGTLTDGEIEIRIDINRQEYEKAYMEYVGETCDGNISASDMIVPEFDPDNEFDKENKRECSDDLS